MKNFMFVLIALVVLTGCQHKESQVPNADERKDIAHKLILKSFNDLQNKDLKATIVDLETSIKINPSEPQAYLLLGQILLKLQQYDQAAGFLDMTAKNFPDDGTIFYMLAVANKMDGKKLPAVMAARHSVEVFQAQNDRDNMLKSAALLHELVADMPDAKTAAPDQAQADATQPQVNAEQMPANGND